MNEYELYHHGVKGQKWGVRRTAAQLGHRVAGAASKTGKVLYKGASKAGKVTGRAVGKGAKKAEKAAIATAKKKYAEEKEKRYYKKLHKKKLSQMTDKEIADLTNRVKQEANLKDIKYESRVQNARKFYKNVAQKPLETVVTVYAKEAAKKMFSDDDDNSGNNNNNNNSNNNSNSNNSNNNSGSRKKQKQTPSDVEFDVDVSSAQSGAKGIKGQKWKTKPTPQQKQDFDNYFESEVRKEQERRRVNAQNIRR